MDHYFSEPRWFSIGHAPPRTPERPDAQVPVDASLGHARHGRCSHVYFRSSAEPEDAAFGFLDLEVAIQLRRNGQVAFDLYCIGDGFQSGCANGKDKPLRFEVWGGDRRLASVDWAYPAIACGQSDPLAFSTDIALSPADFASADRIFMPASPADVQSCTG